MTWVDGYQSKNAYVMTNIYRCLALVFYQTQLMTSILIVTATLTSSGSSSWNSPYRYTSSPVTMLLIILFLKVVIFPECRPLLELSGEVQCLGALSGKSTSHREINKIQNLKNTQLNTELKNTTLKNQPSVLASPPSQHAGFSVQGFRCACHQNRC